MYLVWSYYGNNITIHDPMNVKFIVSYKFEAVYNTYGFLYAQAFLDVWTDFINRYLSRNVCVQSCMTC